MHDRLYTPLRRHWFKFCLGWAACFTFRLLPGRLPNVEPILGSVMPFSERFGALSGAGFAAASIVIYDALTHALGMWTAVTAVAYAGVAALGAVCLRNNRGDVRGYLAYAVAGTLLYDALTGLTVGPLFFGQPLAEAFTGQIPFTIRHLLGNLVFAAILSPILYRWVAANPALEFGAPRLRAHAR